MDLVAERGDSQAVILKEEKLFVSPTGGAKAKGYRSRDGEIFIFLGSYDHDSAVNQILVDVDSLDWT